MDHIGGGTLTLSARLDIILIYDNYPFTLEVFQSFYDKSC